MSSSGEKYMYKLRGTVLGIEEKLKNTDNSRHDLAHLNIRSKLHLYDEENKLKKPQANYYTTL